MTDGIAPPAAPPVPDDAAMPEDVRRDACRAAANALARDFATPTGLDSEQVARAVSAAGAVIYPAGLAARRPAGVEAGEVVLCSGCANAATRWGDHPAHGRVPLCNDCAQPMLDAGCYVSPEGPNAPAPPRPAGVDRAALEVALEAALRDGGRCHHILATPLCPRRECAMCLAAAVAAAPLLGGEPA